MFNFLCSSALAGRDYFVWRRLEHVLGFLDRLPASIQTLDDYLHGDCTIAIVKTPDQPLPEP